MRTSANGIGIDIRCTLLVSVFALQIFSPVHAQADMSQLDRIPEGTLSQMTDPVKSIGYPGLAWHGTVVTVAFNGGNPKVYPLIEAAAKEWTSNGGRLQFSFRTPGGAYRTWSEADLTPRASIRIGFFTDLQRRGYWSAVGVLAKRINPSEATMNFGDLGTSQSLFYDGKNAQSWRRTYARSTILHEFGHALGLNHEHFHPSCQADLKLDYIVSSLLGPPNNWTKSQAMYNMDWPTYAGIMAAQSPGLAATSPTINRSSVMLYTFSGSYYKSGDASPCRPVDPMGYATSLSAGDRQYYMSYYQ